MTDQQILERAIQKAVKGGWHVGVEWLKILRNTDLEIFTINQAPSIIFSHDFAKALWGDKTSLYTEGYYLTKKDIEKFSRPKARWQYHLQQMVVAPDPIKYMGDNI